MRTYSQCPLLKGASATQPQLSSGEIFQFWNHWTGQEKKKKFSWGRSGLRPTRCDLRIHLHPISGEMVRWWDVLWHLQAFQALGEEEPAGPGRGGERGQEQHRYCRGCLGGTLRGRRDQPSPWGTGRHLQEQRYLRGHRKSGGGRPEESTQAEAGFMPHGFRTNQADPF